MGNARTALFSALLSRRERGAFVLRIEDTDQERSREEFVHAVQEDLWWLSLQWQEGPVTGGEHGPYRQSERAAVYDQYFDQLVQQDKVYPCFCSTQELNLARKIQVSSGQPPRYSGKCARLSKAEVAEKIDQGLLPTLRFRVPAQQMIEFEDLVRGKQAFKSDEIGDFIIRRADGTTAFFFCNAVDDALMGVTHVLRGEDHLTNTPRQLLILDALGLDKPQYGHISLIVGHDGSPLSKRHGSRSIRELREQGYLADAVTNYLARLGHHYESDAYMDIDQLAANFDVARLGRSPARYDAHQLLHWQHQALARASLSDIWEWMGSAVHDIVPEDHRADFIETIRPNISFPEHAARWARIVYTDPLLLDDHAREIVAAAGKHFFAQALQSVAGHASDFKAFAKAVGQLSGAKGKDLFLPLRVALTGEAGGPEMARLMPLLGEERVRARLEACLVD